MFRKRGKGSTGELSGPSSGFASDQFLQVPMINKKGCEKERVSGNLKGDVERDHVIGGVIGGGTQRESRGFF